MRVALSMASLYWLYGPASLSEATRLYGVLGDRLYFLRGDGTGLGIHGPAMGSALGDLNGLEGASEGARRLAVHCAVTPPSASFCPFMRYADRFGDRSRLRRGSLGFLACAEAGERGRPPRWGAQEFAEEEEEAAAGDAVVERERYEAEEVGRSWADAAGASYTVLGSA